MSPEILYTSIVTKKKYIAVRTNGCDDCAFDITDEHKRDCLNKDRPDCGPMEGSDSNPSYIWELVL